jgi:hypothetical protein
LSSPRIPDIESAVRQALSAGEENDLLRRIRHHNAIIPHNYAVAQTRVQRCGLPGCDERFPIELLPGQLIYPKYCERHRSEFQREQQRHPQGF